MEAFNSCIESCHTIKALLPEWCNHRVKVEEELRELAHQFEEWEVEAIRIAIGSMATGSDAGEGSSDGAQLPTVMIQKIRKRRGGRFRRNSQRKGFVFKFVCSDSLRKRIDDTVALLEKDKTLTENLIKAIETLKEKEVLFLEKIDYGSFEESRDFLVPSDTDAYTLLAVVWHLSRQNFFEPDFLSDMLCMLVDLKLSLQLAEAVRNIKNLAVEGSRCRCQVPSQLRSLADSAKWECQHLRHLIMEYLPIP
ncbi:unnamed protein product [Cylicocyclus nassatus]|uniref:Uncharacterized protein n=1 Tax=Cylicocyclus nassatus TaxID=53992 RepID=A0AA36H3V8_CYLNA|nr:unnamed protein product [Cylicocyclus nassatus]